ncbi:MAG: hypothetical protein EOM90_07195 [Alphaproteobacteria bacterium]|nr:hypothetical protein [Alphaproteobacteria bacterium]
MTVTNNLVNLEKIAQLLDGQIITDAGNPDRIIEGAFASDLMSDVLTLPTNHLLLLTGLVNIQAIRTAEMSDIDCIVFVRNKKVTVEMTNLANENGIAIIHSPFSMYKASGILYQAGIKPVY